jgi:hypothetical protein
MRVKQSLPATGCSESFATLISGLAAYGGRLHSREMREPTGARLTSDAALLLL